MRIQRHFGQTAPLAPESSAGSLGEPQYCFPATVAQQAFWYLDQLEPGNPAWNIAVRFDIQGPLVAERLQLALNQIVGRHEILRTTFTPAEDQPMQMLHASATIPLPMEDLSQLPTPEREAREDLRTVEEASRGFDLETGPLFRTRLLRLGPEEHRLLVTLHHIVSDGWSIGIISDEIAAHYQALSEGRPASIPPLALQFADFAVWQDKQAQRLNLDAHRAYWAEKLAGLQRCEIPPDHPRPPVKTHNGNILSTVLPADLTDKLATVSRRRGCTLFLTALAALKLLLWSRTGQEDVHVGALLAGRDRVELEPLIGIFINTVVLRTSLSSNPTFPTLLQRVRQTAEEAMTHRDLHFSQLVELIRPLRDLSRPTLYSINFIYQRDFVKPVRFAGLRLTPLPSKSPGAIYDLNFFMVQRADGWRFSCEYNCDLYDASTVDGMIAQYRAILEAIAADPDRKISELCPHAQASPETPARRSIAGPLHTVLSAMPQNSKKLLHCERIAKNEPNHDQPSFLNFR